MNLFLKKITPFRLIALLTFVILVMDFAEPLLASFFSSNDDRLLRMTGKWQADLIQSDERGPYVVRKTVEFVGKNKIIYNQFLLRKGRLQEIEYYNLSFLYEFVGENHLVLTARVGDKWNITNNGKNIIITDVSFVGNGEYERVASISWHLFSLLIGFWVFWAFHSANRYRMNHKSDRTSFDEKNLVTSGFSLSRLLNSLLIIIMFGIGAYLGTKIWYWWPTLFIRIPWDAVILLEVNLLIIAWGLKLIIQYAPHQHASQLRLSKWQYYAGVIFGGLGFFGSLGSLLWLSLSILTRGFLL